VQEGIVDSAIVVEKTNEYENGIETLLNSKPTNYAVIAIFPRN
jgi:hypothetical protein